MRVKFSKLVITVTVLTLVLASSFVGEKLLEPLLIRTVSSQ